jgi:hypothetical protein
MSKLEKMLGRAQVLIQRALRDEVYCLKHQRFLLPYEVIDKKCYNGSHGKKYCRYVQFR